MKINALSTICKNASTVYVFCPGDDDHKIIQQWIGTGSAIYLIENLPRLEREAALTILGIPQNKWPDYAYKQDAPPPGINLEDYDHDEYPAEQTSRIKIDHMGATLSPIATRGGGIIYINTAYLKPLADRKGEIQLYVRNSSTGGQYIVAKDGMMIQAAIMPRHIYNEVDVAEIESIASRTIATYNANRDADQQHIQLSIYEPDEIADDESH